ncbi:hypothetical protein EXN61_21960 [Agrobacterium tumefaciens]|uniref:Uncharacterized protein n=1 Tax=Agrobacterium tumefaciens TaxID=358 RepID=A0A546XS26_AGRTU|nr:hypothetical protein [Agrobacterium tumefaciens]TRB03524.1 hypothetical protein EXN61_21960 [Agrobacterium tumefaciens]
MTKSTAANTNRRITARDIAVKGFVPAAVASTDFNGGRILGTFTAHIKPLGVTIVDMTLAHHDVTKFTVAVTYKTRMTQPINVTPGGSNATALAEAAGRAWNAMSAEEIRDLRQLYASKADAA